MRNVRTVAVVAVVVIAIALLLVKLLSGDGPLASSTPPGTGLSSLTIGTATKIRWSPDGRRLAVVEGGSVAVVGLDDGKASGVTGKNVVDVAWMPDSKRVLVVEGPIPTGQVATINLQGKVNGAADLRPSIAFGAGEGLAVDARGTRAAAIAVTRDDLGGVTHRDLAVIELKTGHVRVYPTPRDETHPVFVGNDVVAVASTGDTGPARLDFVDIASGAVDAGRPIVDGPFTRAFGDEVVVARRAAQGAERLIAVSARTGRERILHVTEAHRHVIAVDATTTRCLVRVVEPGGAAHLAIEAF